MSRIRDWWAKYKAEYRMSHEFIEYRSMLPRWEAEVLTFVQSKWGSKRLYWVNVALEFWLLALGFTVAAFAMAKDYSAEEGRAVFALAAGAFPD